MRRVGVGVGVGQRAAIVLQGLGLWTLLGLRVLPWPLLSFGDQGRPGGIGLHRLKAIAARTSLFERRPTRVEGPMFSLRGTSWDFGQPCHRQSQRPALRWVAQSLIAIYLASQDTRSVPNLVANDLYKPPALIECHLAPRQEDLRGAKAPGALHKGRACRGARRIARRTSRWWYRRCWRGRHRNSKPGLDNATLAGNTATRQWGNEPIDLGGVVPCHLVEGTHIIFIARHILVNMTRSVKRIRNNSLRECPCGRPKPIVDVVVPGRRIEVARGLAAVHLSMCSCLVVWSVGQHIRPPSRNTSEKNK